MNPEISRSVDGTSSTRHAPDPGESIDFSTVAWAGARSQAWLANADRLEAMLEPVHDPLFTGAALDAAIAMVNAVNPNGRPAARRVRRPAGWDRPAGWSVSTSPRN